MHTIKTVQVITILVGEIYEDMKLYSYAFKAYNEMVSRWPEHAKRQEIMERQLAIADRFKDEKLRYKWKLPWQDTFAIPIPRIFTHGRTPELYHQIVTNAPFGPLAPMSQFKMGESHEKAIGFWGGRDRYKEAVAAYQLAADRYGRRDMKGDKESLLTAEEVAERSFKSLDANKDGIISLDEFKNILKKQQGDTPGMDDETAAECAARAIDDFIEGLGMPHRLRELEIPREDLLVIAEMALDDGATKNNAIPITSVDQMMQVLEAAF